MHIQPTLALSISPIQCGEWMKSSQQTQLQAPTPRIYHSMVYHKNSIFIVGGISSNPNLPMNESQQKMIYKYNLNNKTWNKMQTNFLGAATFGQIYSHSAAVHSNMMYVIGGRDAWTKQYVSFMWSLNLDSLNWKKLQFKGYTPQHRQNATMLHHNKSIIFLYGGQYNGQLLNDIHIYKIDAKIWLHVNPDSYQYKIPCRLRPAICSYGDYIYLFGGQTDIPDGKSVRKQQLNDFYQLRVMTRVTSLKPDVWVKKIFTSFSPSERNSILMPYNDKYIMLYGGQNSVEGQDSNQSSNIVWLYNVYQVKWRIIKLKGDQNVSQEKFTMICLAERTYVFGGLKNNLLTNSKGIKSFWLDSKQLDIQISKQKNDEKLQQVLIDEIQGKLCFECQETKNKMGKKRNQYQMFRQIIDEQCPFFAIGLLVDNCLLTQATFCNVYMSHVAKEKYCLIEDNGKSGYLWETSYQFIRDMTVWRTNVEEDIDTFEQYKEKQDNEIVVIHKKNILKEELKEVTKEAKELKQNRQRELKQKEEEKQLRKQKDIAKRNYKKQNQERKLFSKNLKIGALRIGQKLLYVSKYGSSFENRRVFALQKSKSHGQLNYKVYYYIIESGSLIDANMQAARKYIEEEYKLFLRLSNDKKQAKNFLIIGDLKEMETSYGVMESQLKEYSKINDVLFGEKKTIELLEEYGYVISDMIDVSLRCYLSLLYLKNQNMTIGLSVGDHKVSEVYSTDFFNKIDALAKSDKIIDLANAFDFQYCNILEVYYNSNSKRVNTFHNGVLFYHQNRLITRYKHQLGELFPLNKHLIKGKSNNILSMFGFIEVDEEFYVNIFKTNFIRQDLLEAIHTRLKFVQLYARHKIKSDDLYFYIKHRKLDHREEKPQPRKKIKHIEENIPNNQENQKKQKIQKIQKIENQKKDENKNIQNMMVIQID